MFFAIFIGVFVFLACGIAFAPLMKNSLRQRRDAKLVQRSLKWPETQGRVICASPSGTFLLVQYEYSVRGVPLFGEYAANINPTTKLFNDSPEMKQFLMEFQPGQLLIVRYNPDDPRESVFYCRGDVTSAIASDASRTAATGSS